MTETTLSNSSFSSYQKCPLYFYEKYWLGLGRAGAEPDYLQFGSRFHQLLQAHYTGMGAAGVGYNPPAPPELPAELENEAQAMLAAYKAAYPTEPFEVIEIEKRFQVETEGLRYIGRFDMVVRDRKSKRLCLFETKTEKRGSKRNLPEAWAARTQATLYAWGCLQVFGEVPDNIILNVCTRGSGGGQFGPSFRRDTLERTSDQITQAVSDLQAVAKAIQAGSFPRYSNSCVSEFGVKCEYYTKHIYGADESLVQIAPYSYLEM